jgi:hypothetical protein
MHLAHGVNQLKVPVEKILTEAASRYLIKEMAGPQSGECAIANITRGEYFYVGTCRT